MEKEKMTIHRGLSELKLIDAKIEKQINEIAPTGIFQNDKLVNNHIKQDDFKKNVLSKYDSINGLISRKNLIKSAIVKANSITSVKIADKEMTIADAINFKGIVKYKRQLAENLKAKHQQVIGMLNLNNEKVEQRIQSILEATFGKDNVQVEKTDIDAVYKPFMEKNEFRIFDPLNVVEEIEKIEKEIGEFEAEVDAVLSEINAVTMIEI